MMQKIFSNLKNNTMEERLTILFSLMRGMMFGLRHSIRKIIFIRGHIRLTCINGHIEFSDYVKIYPDVRIACVGGGEKALLRIGRSSAIGDRTEIHVGKKIIIGDRVMISWDCVIIDRDYHGIDGQPEECRSVIIEDDVLICCRAIILKGVRIGHHAIIGAGAVVTKDVPPYGVAAGNPARVLRVRAYETANY
jgi:acetyltransferase-like isoleucine patch superfamily enzyme